ncbi:MAG: M60 family peptidase N-terminal accessory domain-containing protein, partial [Fuerstiella sp.]
FMYTVEDPGGYPSTATVSVSVNAPIDINAVRTQILSGVGATLPNPIQPGKLLPYGPTAFSLANENGQDSTHSVLVASTMGAGRVVVMNDHQWLNMSSHGGDASMGAVYRNSIDWLGQQVSGSAGSKNIKVVTLNNQANADWLTSQRYTNVVNSTWANLAAELTNAEVFIAGWMGNNVSAANLDIVSEYVKGGGGVFVADYGAGYIWWWNKPVAEAPANLLLEDAGVFLTSNIIWTGGPVAVQHATETLTGYDILNIINKSVTVDAVTETYALETFALLLNSLPADNALRSALSAAFAEHRFGDVQASPANSISDDLSKAKLTAEASWLQGLRLEEIPAHPSAGDVYGGIPVDALRTRSQAFTIDVSVTGMIATGAYAVPGEIVTIEVPASLVGQGYKFRISGHNDNISGRGSWDRLPYGIAKAFDIDSTTMQIVNSFGGTIYLDIGGGAAGTAPTLGPVDLTMTDAIEAPTFVLGQMTDLQWQTERLKPGAYAELISERLAISVPSS